MCIYCESPELQRAVLKILGNARYGMLARSDINFIKRQLGWPYLGPIDTMFDNQPSMRVWRWWQRVKVLIKNARRKWRIN